MFQATDMSLDEDEIIKLDTENASVSGSIFESARLETLAAGQSVMSNDNGTIYLFTPDGRREEVKKIAPPIVVKKGAIIHLK